MTGMKIVVLFRSHSGRKCVPAEGSTHLETDGKANRTIKQ